MARKLAAVAFSLGCFHASSLMALGLGEMELDSFLNEPLNASVDLLNLGGLHEDEIRVRLATSEDFDKLGMERAYFLTTVTFEVVSDGRGGAKILIRSEDPVLEPYLDFIVEARWPSGRLLREYTVLVDPPVFSQSTPVVSASERVAATEGEPAAGVPAPLDYNERYSSSAGDTDAGIANLASGTGAQRDYGASAQGSPAPGSRYTIRRDQTLWEIANAAKPAGVTVHQTMLDIQRLNPDAFINGNINRIKAGYVIYLPSAADISSADVSSALAEVREQNAAWREGRDSTPYTGSGPSLRISAEPEESAEVATSTQPGTGGSQTPAAAEASSVGTAAVGELASSSDTQARLAALEEQLATLQRIVSLKDDQIAALQSALKDAGGTIEDSGLEAIAPETAEVLPETALESVDVEAQQSGDAVAVTPAVEETRVAETSEAKKPEPAVAPAKSPVPATDEGWASYLLYVLGALVLAIAGLVYMRRRSEADAEADEEEALPLPAHKPTTNEDVFADVHLQDQELEVVPVVEEPAAVAAEPTTPSLRDNRGYGERKHDEYASDVDAADALAEADIYIAYGRHPQAIDLLNNALSAEPGNPVYRLKLLEIYAELGNRVAATAELNKIEATGDRDCTARAEALMQRFSAEQEPTQAAARPQAPVSRDPGLSPNPLEIFADSDETLEEDFSGLEIEEPRDAGDEDDLDLSVDFNDDTNLGAEDEELVIAADSNALSTKLDLARAYLDMGDGEGARQILDEVVAEGADDLKTEAQALLSRIG